ncbi:hypothetical protein [Aminiphilus circumscriptus]|jgi:hypothetical protein|uniref:hypothetical protein n=1 Tax=Aminiphilus circumscriptus TaxID=290732 RepID=UPI00047852B3|nr:hypothetical protein [Aminiphilus circumscriptus]
MAYAYSQYVLALRNACLDLKQRGDELDAANAQVRKDAAKFLNAMARVVAMGERDVAFAYEGVSFSIVGDDQDRYTCTPSFRGDDAALKELAERFSGDVDLALAVFLLAHSGEIMLQCIEAVQDKRRLLEHEKDALEEALSEEG